LAVWTGIKFPRHSGTHDGGFEVSGRVKFPSGPISMKELDESRP
jgi:hypothetical protein